MTNKSMTLEEAFEMTKGEVDRMLHAAPSLIRVYTSHLAKAFGKLLRAKAVLVCAMDENGQVHEDAVYFASAIEVLHLATLVHDDIMDDADLRRGIETIQKKFGKRTAVICGDYLLSAALKQLQRPEDRSKYDSLQIPAYVEQICMGELRQNVNNRNYDLNLFRYLSIINGKTAALFEASYFAGAIVHETDEKRLQLFRKVGRYTGVIFQLTDDCIDYEVEESVALKDVQSDFEQGVITLPVIFTFWKKPELKEQAKAGKLLPGEVIQAVKNSDGVGYTKKTAKRYYEKAMAALELLELPEVQKQYLVEILDKSYYGLKGKVLAAK